MQTLYHVKSFFYTVAITVLNTNIPYQKAIHGAAVEERIKNPTIIYYFAKDHIAMHNILLNQACAGIYLVS